MIEGLDPEAQIESYLESRKYEEAIELIAESYLREITLYCYKMLYSDRQWAEDVAQKVFEKIVTGITQFRQEASVKTWLYKVAHNECLTEISTIDRRRKVTQKYRNEIQYSTHASSSVNIEKDYIAQSQQELVWQALDRLDPIDRSILMMRFGIGIDNELTMYQIANIVGMSRATIYRKLEVILTRLKRTIENEAG